MTRYLEQDALYRLAERVDLWVKSPEGQVSLAKTAESIKTMLEEAEANRKLDHEILLKPMTI
jgi:hypothetical protein